MSAGTAALKNGTAQLKGYPGAGNDPAKGDGLAALSQGLDQLEAAANGPQGLVPLAVIKDQIAKLADGGRRAYAGAGQLDAGAAKLNDGAGQLKAGIGSLTTGAAQLDDGAARLKAGFATLAGKLNATDPQNPGVVLGTSMLAEGTAKIRVGMDGVPGNPDSPGLIYAANNLQDGTTKLSAGINGGEDPANPGLLAGTEALSDGTVALSRGTGQLQAGSAQLADGTGQLADGNGKLDAGSVKLADGAGKLADGNAKIAAGTQELHSKVAAVSPSSWLDNPAVALVVVALLVAAAVGAYLVLRRRSLRPEAAA